jgi:hypothetical protein
MPENLLQPEADAAMPDMPPATTPCPPEVPEKFWDAASGNLRTEALLKSYRELERRLSQRFAPPGADAAAEELLRFRQAMGIPETPDGYEIASPHELCCADPEVNAALHGAHFTNSQAQLVYELAAQKLLPLIAEAAATYEADRQREKLAAHFGGEDRFRQMAAQIAAWGRARLPAPVFEALCTTAEGVQAIERMMQGEEPALPRDLAAPAAQSEAELRAMMRDPRYWRAREPEFVRRVTEGFRRLVGG